MKEAVEHVWTVVCANSSIDASKNNISLFNVLEQIQAHTSTPIEDMPKDSALPIELQIISLWKNPNHPTQTKVKGLIELIGPNLETIESIDFPLNFEVGRKRLRTIVNVEGLKLNGAGEYQYKVSYYKDSKKVAVASIPLEISITYDKNTKTT